MLLTALRDPISWQHSKLQAPLPGASSPRCLDQVHTADQTSKQRSCQTSVPYRYCSSNTNLSHRQIMLPPQPFHNDPQASRMSFSQGVLYIHANSASYEQCSGIGRHSQDWVHVRVGKGEDMIILASCWTVVDGSTD